MGEGSGEVNPQIGSLIDTSDKSVYASLLPHPRDQRDLRMNQRTQWNPSLDGEVATANCLLKILFPYGEVMFQPLAALPSVFGI